MGMLYAHESARRAGEAVHICSLVQYQLCVHFQTSPFLSEHKLYVHNKIMPFGSPGKIGT